MTNVYAFDHALPDMSSGPYGPSIRVITKPGPPPSCDMFVQIKDTTHPEGWRTCWRTNDMSNEFAHTECHAMAQNLRKHLREGEYPNV